MVEIGAQLYRSAEVSRCSRWEAVHDQCGLAGRSGNAA